MRDRLIELIKEGEDMTPCANKLKYVCKGIKCRDCERESIADHLLADGWIRLPCKVGDTVYALVSWCDYIGCHFEGCAGCSKCNDKGVVERKFYLSQLPQIGKTVFLTREEAEKALKERERK